MTVKRATKKRVAKPRARTKKAKSVYDQLEESFVGTPIKVANKTFLASLGVVATMQTELTKLQSDFGKTFEKLAKDGEKVRNRYRAEFKGLKKDARKFGEDVKEYGEDLVEDVVEVKDKAIENIRSIAA